MPDQIEKLLLTRDEAAEALSCCARYIDQLIRAGELTAIRLGRAVRIERSELERFVRSKRESAAA